MNPEYQAFGALTLRQPLLKGFGPSARSDLSFAESNLDRASARYDGAVLAVRAEVESVYWQLYAAERNHAVTQLIRDRAAAFHEDAQLRAKAGMIGPSAGGQRRVFPDRGRTGRAGHRGTDGPVQRPPGQPHGPPAQRGALPRLG